MIHLTIKGVGYRMPVSPDERDDREQAKKLLSNAVVLKKNKRRRK